MTRAAFITAWNPGSVRRGDTDNRQAGRALAGEVAALGYRALRYRARAPDPAWDEDGLFVLGIDADTATALAWRYGQIAFLAVERGAPVRLRLTSRPPPA